MACSSASEPITAWSRPGGVAATITVNWIDWLTLATVLVSILRGTRYGVLAGVLDLLALFGAFLAASALYQGVVPSLHTGLFLPTPWAGFLAFVFIWLGLYVSVGALIRLMHAVKTAPVSEMLGGVMGGIRGVALMGAFLIIALASPFHEGFESDAKKSPVAGFVLRGYESLMLNVAPSLSVHIPRLGPGGLLF